jgi:hypothetical protein
VSWKEATFTRANDCFEADIVKLFEFRIYVAFAQTEMLRRFGLTSDQKILYCSALFHWHGSAGRVCCDEQEERVLRRVAEI